MTYIVFIIRILKNGVRLIVHADNTRIPAFAGMTHMMNIHCIATSHYVYIPLNHADDISHAASERILRNMGIYLSCNNISMSKHQLHRTKISAAFKQMGCKRMPQGMRTDIFGYTGNKTIFFNKLPKALPAQTIAVAI